MGGVQHEVELAPSIYYGIQNSISTQDLVSCSNDQPYSAQSSRGALRSRCYTNSSAHVRLDSLGCLGNGQNLGR